MYINQTNIKPKMQINQGIFGRIMYKNQGKSAFLLILPQNQAVNTTIAHAARAAKALIVSMF